MSALETQAIPVSTPLSARVQRHAHYFGPDDAPLFGWMHLPKSVPQRAHGIVLCPPIGVDYVNTYPVLRLLADRLAAEGVPVLRFDFAGSGNSCDFDTDPRRVETWLENIGTAREHLIRVSGCADAGLFGVRIGALLAATAARDLDIPFLVLWGAVTRGRTYIREMRAIQMTMEGGAESASGPDIDAGGFMFTAATQQALTALNLAEIKPRAPRVVIADRDDLGGNAALRQAWSNDTTRVELVTLPGFADMLVSPHNPKYRVPLAAVDELARRIVSLGVGADWVGAASGGDVLPSVATQGSRPEAAPVGVSLKRGAVFRATPDTTAPNVRESALRFGPDGNRFAIATEPLTVHNPKTPWFILSNSGALHTAGPNRLYVLLVRALAQAGFRCLRIDFHNVGDSVVDPLPNENRLYEETTSAELSAAIEALHRERGAASVVLMGLCSGAYASFHGGLELQSQSVIGSILVNPLRFHWDRDSMLGDFYEVVVAKDQQQQFQHVNSWQYYLGAMRNPASWRSLLSGRADLRAVVNAVVKRVQRAAREAFERVAPIDRLAGPGSDRLARDIRRFVEQRRKLAFVFARSDPGYALLVTPAGPVVRRYLRDGKIDLWFIERADHTFTGRAQREDFIRTLTKYVARQYGEHA